MIYTPLLININMDYYILKNSSSKRFRGIRNSWILKAKKIFWGLSTYIANYTQTWYHFPFVVSELNTVFNG